MKFYCIIVSIRFNPTLLQGNIELQGIRQGRQFLWRTYGDTFFPPGFAGDEFAGRLADRKLSGYKGKQMLIGLTINRCGFDSQFQPVAMQS